MPPSAEQILADLDAHGDNLDFPAFDNLNITHVDGRVHAYRGDDSWALVIEQIVFWPSGWWTGTISFPFGDCPRRDPGAIRTFDSIEAEWNGPDDEGVAGLPDQVLVRGRPVTLDRQAIQALIDDHAHLDKQGEFGEPFLYPEHAALVWLTRNHRAALFHTEEELSRNVTAAASKILTLDTVNFPNQEFPYRPSESETFRLIADVLESGDPERYQPTAAPNSGDWVYWRTQQLTA